MTENFTLPQPRITLSVASQPAKGGMAVTLRPAAEQPAPGQPGKQAGEVLYSTETGAPALVISLGGATKVAAESYRQAGGGLANYLLKNKVTGAQIALEQFEGGAQSAALRAFLEGVLLGAFRFDRYKTGEPTAASALTLVSAGDSAAVEKLLAQAQKVAAAVNLSRDWAHEPANVINPVTLAARVKEISALHNLKVTVLDDRDLEKMGAGAIHAVGKGSKTPSRLIIVEYPGSAPAKDAAPTVIIGKAITFDTGGYSIKPSDSIVGMKYDKSGAVTALATVIAAADLGLKQPVAAVIAAAENMVSGDAYRPDDIIRSLSGKTIEIISTDAEGRLVLADALTYAQRNLNPRVMIDLVTLTGGVVVALGKVRAGLLSNNDALANALFQAGENAYERLWRLPLDEAYFEQIRGDDADIRNSGGRQASTIIGDTFLNQFVDASVPWAHLDIAGVSAVDKDMPYCQKGATGFGVRLLVEYLQGLE